MKINITYHQGQPGGSHQSPPPSGTARDGANGSDIISVASRSPLLDGIRHRTKWGINRFESDLFGHLLNDRRMAAELLNKGHRYRMSGNPDKAEEFFLRGLDYQERHINRLAYDSSVIEGNALLNEGINAMTTLICGGAETAFNNANAQLGVGTGTPTALAGTCTFTQWSKTVTGSGTAFDTALAVGDWIRAATSTTWYRVEAIASATSLTIAEAFEEATEAGVTGYELDATSTDLPGTVVWKAMDTSYPTFGSGQNMIFQSVFGSADANQAWENFGVRNGAAANKNMNLRYDSQGTKTSGQTWTLNLQIDLM